MATMKIDISTTIAAAIEKMDSLQKSIKDKVVVSALNDTIKVANTQAVSDIRKDYSISATKIKSRVKIYRATKTTLTARLRAIDKAVNLKEYGAKAYGAKAFERGTDGRLRPTTKAGGVSVKVKKSRKRIPHAFIGKSGNVFIRAEHAKDKRGVFTPSRTGLRYKNGYWLKSGQLKALLGPGVNQVFGARVVQTALDRKAREHFPARLRHYLNRLVK